MHHVHLEQIRISFMFDEYFNERYDVHFKDAEAIFLFEGCTRDNILTESHSIAMEEASREWMRKEVSENVLIKLKCDPAKAWYAGK